MKKFDYTFKALWTVCQISLIWDDWANFNNIINKIYNIIISFENRFSRFKNDSLLSRLNDTKNMDVDDEFMSLLLKSKEIYIFTKWYFNPLVNISNIWYSSTFDKNDFKITNFSENLDFLQIKNYWNNVVLQSDMNLDFWSIAKWFLADVISQYLQKNGFKNFLINLGWDLKCSWINHLWQNWKIWVTHPKDKNSVILELELKNKSISTSWIYLRNWNIDGKNYHHIKTPKTNKNNNEILSCSIIDNFWYKTDALATAVISMWLKKWLDFCKKNNLDFYIVDQGLNIYKK